MTLNLADYKRQKQAQVLREYLLRTDPKAREQLESSRRSRAVDRERRLANEKAAAALQFSVGDVVQVRRHRDRLDGKRGTVLNIRALPSGRRLIDCGFQFSGAAPSWSAAIPAERGN